MNLEKEKRATCLKRRENNHKKQPSGVVREFVYNKSSKNTKKTKEEQSINSIMSSMLAIFFAITASCSVNSVAAQNNDLFNYAQADKNENGVTSRGQPNWGQVRCGNAEICVSTGFGLGKRNHFFSFPSF